VRSTKTEYRTRLKAQLMAADGAATRAIAREVGCAIRIVSKWQMRYARDRLAGFDETGNRGAAPKYGPETGRRILALLDTKPPSGYANWTGSLIVFGDAKMTTAPSTGSLIIATLSKPGMKAGASKIAPDAHKSAGADALSDHQARRREWDSVRGYHQGQRP